MTHTFTAIQDQAIWQQETNLCSLMDMEIFGAYSANLSCPIATPSRLQAHTSDPLEAAISCGASVVTAPRFSQAQQVCFIGGVGTIKSCQLDSGTWTYAIEMELGPEPDMGRVGFETTILLQEGDIQAVMHEYGSLSAGNAPREA